MKQSYLHCDMEVVVVWQVVGVAASLALSQLELLDRFTLCLSLGPKIGDSLVNNSTTDDAVVKCMRKALIRTNC